MSSMYANKQFLAPMVRVGLLPMRLTALDYGADMVYTDEIVDMKIIGTRRVVNEQLGTIDYVRDDHRDGPRVMFRTHPREREKLIFQIGSSDPQLALQAALTVQQDVAAFDLNCGCPKHFSVHNGMGAALLSTPDLLVDILETLVQNLHVPVTCKIRIYHDIDKTISLIQRLEKTGINAIGVHCRTRSMKRGEPGRWEVFEPIAKASTLPIIANGDIFSQEDRQRILKTGVSSVMFARAAQDNPSVFRAEGPLNGVEAARKYLEYAVMYDNPYQNCKYCLSTMRYGKKGIVERIIRSKCLSDLCDAFGFEDLKEQCMRSREARPVYDDMFPYVPTPPAVEMNANENMTNNNIVGH